MTTKKFQNDFRINIHFSGDEKGVGILKEYFKVKNRNVSLNKRDIDIVKDETIADYVIRCHQSGSFWQKKTLIYSLTLPFKKEAIICSIRYVGLTTFHFIRNMIFHRVQEWEGLKRLQDSSNSSISNDCELKIYKVKDKDKSTEDFLLTKKDNCIYINDLDSIRISIQNNSKDKKFYFSLFYLEPNFEIINLIDGEEILESKEVYRLQEGQAIDYELEDFVKDLNYSYSFFELKLVYSTEDIHDYYKTPLYGFPSPNKIALSNALPFSRDLIRRKKEPKAKEWATDSVRVIIKNPNYKEN